MSHFRTGPATAIAKVFCAGLLAVLLACPAMQVAQGRTVASDPNPALRGQPYTLTARAREPASPTDPNRKSADFLGEPASDDVRRVAEWVVDAHDNLGLPFIIIDKVMARVFLFDAVGRLRGASPALLGLARGDSTVPGIGDRRLSTIRPEERTTPAGRFVASLGHNTGHHDILWVDYANAISLHRVVTSNPKERRLERLAAVSPAERRISYGCINVPVAFYEGTVLPAFAGTTGIVYVLPETRPLRSVFPSLPE